MAGPRIHQKLPAVQVAVGGTSIIKLPIGRTYHAVYMAFSNCSLAEITDIRLVANGVVLHRYDTGTDLDVLNQQNGLPTVGSGDFTLPLAIHFDRKGLRARIAEEFTCLGTGIIDDPTPITTLQLEIDIANSATGATLTAKAEQSGPQLSGLVLKTKLFQYTAPAAGVFEVSDLPRGDLINRVYFKSSAITGVEVERDGFTLFDRTIVENNYILGLDGYKSAPSVGYMFDPSEHGFDNAALTTKNVNDLRFKLTMSGGSSIPVYVEYIGLVGR